MTTQAILEKIADNYEECLVADGFDDAILGVLEGAGRKTVLCYDYEKCIQILTAKDKMSDEEAREFFDYNTVGAFVGDYTPLFLHNWRVE